MLRLRRAAACVIVLALAAVGGSAQSPSPQTPEQFFGFKIGTDGELARYPKVVEYLQHLASATDRLKFEELGKTTMGHPYVLATISAPANLSRLNRLVEINRRLADPRGLSEAEAMKLAQEGRPFYLLYTTIHATEVGNMQALTEIVHRLTTDSSPATREILDNTVVLVVPSQNPDGQVMVIDHWYKTKGTKYERVYPDLYHKYVGHDNNRDWFMFTQKETRLMIDKVQNAFKPQLTHDMHQQGPAGSRIFVPPFDDPYDPNIHPILAQEQARIGLAMSTALVREGKTGVAWLERYDLWAPARQYMVYHGQPRILTEIASINLADPYVNPAGADKPLGPQESRWNFPLPYRRSDWRLRQIVDYGVTVALAGMSEMAKYRTTWMENFYRVNADWAGRKEAPYAFVVPAAQRDPFETRELLEILTFADVEVHRARTPFTAGGQQYAAGSWVIRTAQPAGAFAKTMLERQVYPDLRLFPGGPPKPPYDVTGHTLWMLMGVQVDTIEAPFQADLEKLTAVAPTEPPAFPRPRTAYVIGPESNAAFLAVSKLQRARVPVMRATAPLETSGQSLPAGAWIVPVSVPATKILNEVARDTGLRVYGTDRPAPSDVLRLKPETRIGVFKSANNMPAGWMKWLFEQYDFNHGYATAQDLTTDLASKFDVIVLPSGTRRDDLIRGLDSARHDKAQWGWAFGAGEDGWNRLGEWVKNGGTLLAIGNAVDTARELLDLPVEKVLPETNRRARFMAQGRSSAENTVPASEVNRVMREAFSSPARLAAALRERVVEPTSVFYCPGSLLQNEFDTTNPVAWGMPTPWPVFFESDQAYRIRPGFGTRTEVVGRYPARGAVLQSGWLLGEDLLRDQANVIAFHVGRGYVVTYGSQIDFRAQPRATFKLLFNAMFNGPAITGGPRAAGTRGTQ